jgi:hypothetical protein
VAAFINGVLTVDGLRIDPHGDLAIAHDGEHYECFFGQRNERWIELGAERVQAAAFARTSVSAKTQIMFNFPDSAACFPNQLT